MPSSSARGVTAPRWAVPPLTAACAVYGILITAIAYFADQKLRPIFVDYKMQVPAVTELALEVAHVLWAYHAWVILLPALVALPVIVIPFVPVPVQDESRVRVRRAVRSIVLLIFLGTALSICLAFLTPMIALLQSLAGPSKR